MDKVDENKSFIMQLPDELLVAIATFFNPPIPFELGHFVLPSKFTMEGRQELRALAAACKRFAKVLMPILYRSLVFIDDKRRTKTVDFYKANKVHEHVREIYWQPSCAFSPLRGSQPGGRWLKQRPRRRPLQRHVTHLPPLGEESHVPRPRLPTAKRSRRFYRRRLCRIDDLASIVYGCAAGVEAPARTRNPILGIERRPRLPLWHGDTSVATANECRRLARVERGESVEQDLALVWALTSFPRGRPQFETHHEIDVVKWLVHPDIDLEEGLLEGWAECLGQNARVLQLAAHSGWGRTDLPAKLPDVIRNASWYKVRVSLAVLFTPRLRVADSHRAAFLFAPRRRSNRTRSRVSLSTVSIRSLRTRRNGPAPSPNSCPRSNRGTCTPSPSSTCPRCETSVDTFSHGTTSTISRALQLCKSRSRRRLTRERRQQKLRTTTTISTRTRWTRRAR